MNDPTTYPDTSTIQSFVGEVRDFEDYHDANRTAYLSDALDTIFKMIEDDEIRPIETFWNKYPNPNPRDPDPDSTMTEDGMIEAGDMSASDGLGSDDVHPGMLGDV